MQKMDGFAQSLLDFINENKSENLIIDLRDNYGGDFFCRAKISPAASTCGHYQMEDRGLYVD
jgi:C-terminal processing protease CtpA/Prc